MLSIVKLLLPTILKRLRNNMTTKKTTLSIEQNLLQDLSRLIEQRRQRVVEQANSTLTLLFWDIGRRINP